MPSPRLTPRRRKLRVTTVALAWSLGLIAVVALGVHFANRPAQYDPEEEDRAITSELRINLPPGAPEPKFTDITEAAGLAGFQTFIGPRTSQLPEDMGGGAAFGDFDNDGHDDLFLVSAGGNLGLPEAQLAPSRLYRNRGDGTFELVKSFPELRIRGMGAAWADFDGDGFIDLAVSGHKALKLFRNEGGTGLFTPVELPGGEAGFWAGLAWGDFDNDRAPDLYVCGYLEYQVTNTDREQTSDQFDTAVPFTLNPASFEPARNRLYRNDGDGKFTEIAVELGVTNPTGRSLGAIWCDFDEDGWLDLYVANDVSDNAYYRNERGTFRDLAHAAWIADYRSAMGLAIGDWNNDGDDDIYVTHWVAQENALYDNTYADFFKNPNARQPISSSGRESAPFNDQNRVTPAPTNSEAEKPKARFVDVADLRGLGQMALPFVGWGAEFADFDHDGWLDLIVANGSTLEAAGPAPRKLQAQEAFLLWNHAGQTFHNLAPAHPGLSAKHVSRGLATSDIDGDGDLDFVIVDLDGGVRLFRNDLAAGNWVQLVLRGRNSAGALHGRGEHAVVTIHAGGRQFRRSFNSVSYLSQSTATIQVGLGATAVINRVAVRWHGGTTQEFTGLSPRARWELREGDPVPRRLTMGAPIVRSASSTAPTGGDERSRLLAFWKHQRAGMDAFKLERNYAQATAAFEQALALNPGHEDSLFYLANSFIELGRPDDAIRQLRKLTEVNSRSQRGFQQWGTLRALTAQSPDGLRAAEELLLKARAINPEETGVLQVLGEVALLRGDLAVADERFAHIIAANHRATRALYLRAYLAWKRGDTGASTTLLQQTREALGPDWKPAGMSHEGDVKNRMHVHTTPLSEAFAAWDGNTEPANAFVAFERGD
jgi:enediyne biosynthesis protein E4